MAYVSHEGQRLHCSIAQNTEIAVCKLLELRREFASKCWRAFDTDPSFDYDAAEAEIIKQFNAAIKEMKANDEITIKNFLAEKAKK